MSNEVPPFATLKEVASYLREEVNEKYVLLFAFNGAGKTRLSMEFKQIGKNQDGNSKGGQAKIRDTLYFNAFTEDLFPWDNDLEYDEKPVLRMNTGSHFFDGLQELELEDRIGKLLARYANFDFLINYEESVILFFRDTDNDNAPIPIKISRGEENIFVWCFFLAIVELVVAKEDDDSPYAWVKYIYIDDPISSLDENNAIAVASHLAELLKRTDTSTRIVISTHHHLFYSVACNAVGNDNSKRYFLSEESDRFTLKDTGKLPHFHHVVLLKQLHAASKSGQLHAYHFNMLRGVLEKTAVFHGFAKFSDCIRQKGDNSTVELYARLVNVLSHSNFALFERADISPEDKKRFQEILRAFMENYRFNPKLFPAETQEASAKESSTGQFAGGDPES